MTSPAATSSWLHRRSSSPALKAAKSSRLSAWTAARSILHGPTDTRYYSRYTLPSSPANRHRLNVAAGACVTLRVFAPGRNVRIDVGLDSSTPEVPGPV